MRSTPQKPRGSCPSTVRPLVGVIIDPYIGAARRQPEPEMRNRIMAKTSSFDVSTGVDLQEVDNAVNQAHKEVAQRYDFKGTNCTMQFDRAAASVALEADDAYRLQALSQILREKLAKRKVPLKNLDESKVEEGSLGRARQTIGFKQGIDQETGKKISKDVRGEGFKKVQVQIQGDELRIIAPSKDTLQEVMAWLRAQDYGVELKFGNYR